MKEYKTKAGKVISILTHSKDEIPLHLFEDKERMLEVKAYLEVILTKAKPASLRYRLAGEKIAAIEDRLEKLN